MWEPCVLSDADSACLGQCLWITLTQAFPGSVGTAGDVLLPAPRAWKRNTCDL